MNIFWRTESTYFSLAIIVPGYGNYFEVALSCQIDLW
jgi:hypothetical protein